MVAFDKNVHSRPKVLWKWVEIKGKMKFSYLLAPIRLIKPPVSSNFHVREISNLVWELDPPCPALKVPHAPTDDPEMTELFSDEEPETRVIPWYHDVFIVWWWVTLHRVHRWVIHKRNHLHIWQWIHWIEQHGFRRRPKDEDDQEPFKDEDPMEKEVVEDT